MTNVDAPTKADCAETEVSRLPDFDRDVRSRLRSIQRLPDHRILSELLSSNCRQLRFEAELLLFLGELDRRQLYREQAVPSAFEFCVKRLGYSEDVAYKRVAAARLLRQFPAIYAWLADGRVHLTALLLLKPHLNEDNCEGWLHAARGKSKRQLEQLIATHCPQADVPTTVRRLPSPRSPNPLAFTATPRTGSSTAATAIPQTGTSTPATTVSLTSTSTPATTVPHTSTGASAETSLGTEAMSNTALSDRPTSSNPEPVRATVGRAVSSTASSAQVAPLSSSTYRITFTANARLKRKLDRAGELLSHCVDPKDLPALVERALDELLEHEEKRRYGSTSRVRQEASQNTPTKGFRNQDPDPKGSRKQDPDPKGEERPSPLRSKPSASTIGTRGRPAASPNAGNCKRRRWVPLAVRRAVFERDGGQCTYVDVRGNRCESRHRLELDHIEAHAIGGPDTVANLRLRCKSHNQLAAEQFFGRGHVKRAVVRAAVALQCERSP